MRQSQTIDNIETWMNKVNKHQTAGLNNYRESFGALLQFLGRLIVGHGQAGQRTASSPFSVPSVPEGS